MSVGTRSVLYGAHAFWLHPWFVAWAWWKLYGFPWDPRLWVAFFIHDLGYWGSPNMDGSEGERHPEWAARVMTRLFDRREKVLWAASSWLGLRVHAPFVLYRDTTGRRMRQYLGRWGRFVLYHSRFYAKKNGAKPSRLCIADKLAICLTPTWLYVPMAKATGEIYEYMKDHQATNPGEPLHGGDMRRWHRSVRSYVRRWVEEHRDGREDTWTPETRKARDETGVWS